MTTAIIGAGNLGGALAQCLAAGDESVVLAAKDASHAEELAERVGPLARAAALDYALATADVVVLAVWLDDMKDVIPQDAGLLDGKVVVDPSNPIGFDEDGQIMRTLPHGQSSGSIVASLLPAGAHYVKAFGTLGAVAQLATGANREPRIVLFYATDDDAAEAIAQRLIRAAGFEPF